MTPTYATLLSTLDDGVLTLTLNRPDKLNAWTYQLGAELRAAIIAANDNSLVEAMVVTGAGRAFCAGADIALVFDAQSKDEPPYKAQAQPEDWVALMRRSKPIIAAINGAAYGVGLTQTLSMDQIICADTANLALPFVKFGVAPEFGSSHFVVQRCGFGVASNLMLTGRTLGAVEAHSLGLVDSVVAPDALLATARGLARAMGQNPLASLLETKRLLALNAAESDIELVLRREFQALDRCYASAEHREAVNAFLEKRPADFRRARHDG